MSSRNVKDLEDAKAIQDALWRQGSVFRGTPEILASLPPYMKVQQDEWLVVCTQSCSVCSENFTDEALVELLAATPLPKYKPTDGTARGKIGHTFHLPVGGIGAEALVCHMGRRAFMRRRLLADFRPHPTWLADGVLNAFKGWIANYYMRIALPDVLVTRLKAPGGIRETISAAINKEIDGTKIGDGVDSFYLYWDPDFDVKPDGLYSISLLAVCDSDDVKEALEQEISSLIGRRSAPLNIEGVLIGSLKVETSDNVTLGNLKGMSRFNEWDNFSELGERLVRMRSAFYISPPGT